MQPAFDHEELLERIEGDIEFLAESVEMLEEDATPLLVQIRAAAGARDAAALTAPAHTLKGMLSNFCASTAEHAAHQVELRARANQLEDIDPLVESLDHETTRVRAALKEFLEGQGT